MKKWRCTVCGEIVESETRPAQCPRCKVPGEKFVEVKEDEELTWAAEHVVGIAKGAPAEIVEGLRSNFEAFFMVGRFGGSFIMRWIPAEKMLLFCGCGCVACTMLVLMNFGRISMIGLLGNYLFEAVMFPTIFSLAVRNMGSLTKSASSILMMTPVGGCGFLLVGIIADATDMVVPFIIPLLCYITVGLYGFGLTVHREEHVDED